MKKSLLLNRATLQKLTKKTATVLNDFFSNIMTNLSIPQYIEVEPVSQNKDDPLMKAIIKYSCILA